MVAERTPRLRDSSLVLNDARRHRPYQRPVEQHPVEDLFRADVLQVRPGWYVGVRHLRAQTQAGKAVHEDFFVLRNWQVAAFSAVPVVVDVL